jgi:Tripartite tricarboxylate transporter TctB family
MCDDGTGAVADRPRQEGERPALGADLIIPALAVAFTTYYLVSTLSLTWEAKANGVVVGVLLYGLIAIQLVRIGRRVASGEATLGLGALAEFDTAQKRRVALVVITALFILTLPWVGISIGLFLTMLASMWVLGERSWRVLIGLSALTSATVYLLFVTFLQTRLPTGPIEALIDWLAGGGA